MGTYLGYDLLDTPPNTREDLPEVFSRSTSTLDPGPVVRSVLVHDQAPAVQRTYLWTCRNRSEITALRDWFDARAGRLVPFWVPTWRQDLLLTSSIGANSTQIQVKGTGYTRWAYPLPTRRHLALQIPRSTIYCRKVVASVEGGDGTDTLTLSSSLGSTFPATGLVSFLCLCRLASDDLAIRYLTESVAEASFDYVELATDGEIP